MIKDIEVTRRVMCAVVADYLNESVHYVEDKRQICTHTDVIIQFNTDDINDQYARFEEWCRYQDIEPF